MPIQATFGFALEPPPPSSRPHRHLLCLTGDLKKTKGGKTSHEVLQSPFRAAVGFLCERMSKQTRLVVIHQFVSRVSSGHVLGGMSRTRRFMASFNPFLSILDRHLFVILYSTNGFQWESYTKSNRANAGASAHAWTEIPVTNSTEIYIC